VPPFSRSPVTRGDDLHVAYQVFGEGPLNLVVVPAFVSNVEHYWDDPTTEETRADFAEWRKARGR
jgi:hypothetical protein